MSVKEFILKVGEVVKDSAIKVVDAIAGASLASLVKFGIIAGISVATVVLIFKFIKAKKKVYTDESNKTIVDRALQKNYADVRNQEELHPLMHKVKKNLKKDLKPRLKNKIKKQQEKYRTTIDEMFYSNKAYDLGEDLDMFIKEMADNDNRRRARAKSGYMPHDNQSLKAVWDNTL